MSAATDAAPRIRITAGHPDPAEVAAVTMALLALAGRADGAPEAPRRRPTTWAGPGGYQSPASWAGSTAGRAGAAR
ncbi:hypothetical protein AD006_18090 [Pseudonocardia sp. EC080610-09]|uniref:acyl-CoA carboxylase epsilon subunit n=1 Tax=unclassified Pseudonocardia TaxID=2619320 RepID=UPI0006CB2BD5|nr:MULTISPECIES: acyl-CoA carboxylase epsilon subunit [unclassified Pseudonocardia]ALE73724.1 hypothetical protein FRP1_12900 [Pseudonocardia sp. EC080625-04]ALL76744.1 hypothetical protein AD006_18090 [Pseudonocardia sp. EC080610-09]ALL83772.1 hypothetical protein AD017_25920 [Pseudonocardia sp. EC080619-01]